MPKQESDGSREACPVGPGPEPSGTAGSAPAPDLGGEPPPALPSAPYLMHSTGRFPMGRVRPTGWLSPGWLIALDLI